MAKPPEDNKRECPTRTDGGDALICHLIDPGTCQERQRRHYHKCHTCAWQNATALGTKHVLPPLREPTSEPVPLRIHRAG